MNISVIEDDKIMANHIAKKLGRNGYGVDIYNNINDFKFNYNYDSDLYIIDISLGKGNGDGFTVIKWLRNNKKSTSPIIIVSSYNDTEKKIYGLDIGADDYLAKPFAPDELLARIRTLLRRNSKCINSSIIKHNNIEFCLENKELKISGKIIHLTKKELLLIELFLLNKGKLITKTKRINSIWGNIEVIGITDNNINVILSKVRKKLGDNFQLKTIINGGYILK